LVDVFRWRYRGERGQRDRPRPDESQRKGDRGDGADRFCARPVRRRDGLRDRSLARDSACFHASTSRSWSSLTGTVHPVSDPAIAPIRSGRAKRVLPDTPFLSDLIATMRSPGSNPLGSSIGRSAVCSTLAMAAAVPSWATQILWGGLPSSAIPIATASPCNRE